MVAPSVSIRLNKTAFEITVQLSNYYLNLRLYCFFKKKRKKCAANLSDAKNNNYCFDFVIQIPV